MDLRKIRILNKLWINGKWQDSVKRKTFNVINPYDESVITDMADSTSDDVDLAVKAARDAF